MMPWVKNLFGFGHLRGNSKGPSIGLALKNPIFVHVIFLVVAALSAWHFTNLRWAMTRPVMGTARILMEGSADMPYQVGLLVSWVVGLISGMQQLAHIDFLSLKSYFVVELFFVFALILLYRYYLSFFIRSTLLNSIFALFILCPLIFNHLFPVHYKINFSLTLPTFMSVSKYFNLYYPNETPSMTFFTLGLILIYKRKWVPYYLLFALATFNKETTCFLTLVYLFTAFGKEGKRTIAIHCGSQFVIWAAIKIFLSLAYGAKEGQAFEGGIAHNLRSFLDPSVYYYVFSNMGFIWIPVLLFFRRIKDDFARRSLLVAIPFLSFVFVTGKFIELRNFGEMIPVVLTGFVIILKELFYRKEAQLPDIKHGVNKAFSFLAGAVPYLIYVAFALAAAAYYTHLRWTMVAMYVKATLNDLTSGAANLPFQLRALVPWAVNLLHWANLPLPFFDKEIKIFYMVEFVSIFGLLLAFRHYLSLFVRNSILCSVFSFSLLYALTFNFLFPLKFSINYPYTLSSYIYFPEHFSSYNLFYPYDMPSIMFFTLGLILIYKRKWVPYYLLFALATFNRETTCFLTLVYLFTAFGKDGKRTIVLHCAAQFVIWMVVKITLHRIYGANEGQAFESGIAHNIRTFLDPSQYYYIFSNMGFVWIPVLLLYRRIRDSFMRRSLLVAIPFLIAVFVTAKFTELRDFGELIPVVLSAFVLILGELFHRAGKDKMTDTRAC
jgi:hypothetical protein